MGKGPCAAGRAAYFIAGDALRGIAALWVFAFHVAFVAYVFHVRRMPGAPQPTLSDVFGWAPGHLIGVGAATVYIFFVLSGYLLGRPFVRALLAGGPLPGLTSYGRGRVLRIVPMFWLVVAIALLRHGAAGADATQIAGIVGFLQTYLPVSPQDDWLGQAWTLDIEAGFYVLLPLGALLAARVLPRRLPPAGRAAALLLGLLALFAVSREAVHFHVPERTILGMLFAFLPGVGLALVEPFVAPRVRGARWASVVAGLIGAGGMLLLAAWELADPVHFNVRAVLAAAGSAGIVGAPLLHQWATGRCVRIYDNAVVRWVGERSYSFYLLHLLVVWEVAVALGRGRPPGELALFTALPSLVASLALAALGYRWVERPFLALRRRRLPAAAAVAPDASVAHLDRIVS